MAVVTSPERSARGGIDIAAAFEPRRVKPVKWWAAAGVAFLLLEAYTLGSWIASGKATPTPAGGDPLPGFMNVLLHGQEIVGVVAFFGFVWWFLVRPWRRDRRISLDGLFLLAYVLIYWQDPLLNYSQTWATFNAHLVNFGSWTGNLPGALAPNTNQVAEPVVFVLAAYIYALFGIVVLANVVMRKAHARWPRLSRPGLAAWTIVAFWVVDLAAEAVWSRSGLYSFGGGIEGLTLFRGHYYQFPIYEAILWGSVWGSWACLRYFRDDKGRTVAERGIDEVPVTPKQKTLLRFLALCGMMNVTYMGLYNIPMQWFGTHADPWPEDTVKRSYLTNGICGPGTEFACSGPGVPIPRPDSPHLAPDGSLKQGGK